VHKTCLAAGVACAVSLLAVDALAQAPRSDRNGTRAPLPLPPSGPALPADPDGLGAPPLLRRSAPEAAEPADPWTTRTEPAFGRTPEVDGDPQGPPVAPWPVDGVLTETEPAAPVDGVDPNVVDTRTAEEIEPFQIPPAPDEQTEFRFPSIEPEPARDRRPARLFRIEPYEATGIGLGTFVVYPEAEIGGLGYSNLFRSTVDPRTDIALETRPAIRAVSRWSVHALELAARGRASFHADFPSEDDREWSAEARGRLDVTRRTNIEAQASHEFTQEQRGGANFRTSSAGGRPEIAVDRAGVTFNHRFNRLSLQLRGTLTQRDVSPVTDADGNRISNDDRDSTRHEGALRASWEFKPELSIFGEVALNEQAYRAPTTSDGLERDSTGERWRLGAAFGSTSRSVRGEASIGTARQKFDNGRLPTLNGVIVDANVAWRLSGLTALLVSATSEVGESTVAGSGAALTRSAGLELRHAFRHHLIGTAGVRYTRSDYAGVSLVEDDITTSAALEYFMSREVMLFARYQHVDFESTNIASNYNADEVRIGVRVRR
jgi:hypothetical protein